MFGNSTAKQIPITKNEKAPVMNLFHHKKELFFFTFSLLFLRPFVSFLETTFVSTTGLLKTLFGNPAEIIVEIVWGFTGFLIFKFCTKQIFTNPVDKEMTSAQNDLILLIYHMSFSFSGTLLVISIVYFLSSVFLLFT